jgi:hypothetical protein
MVGKKKFRQFKDYGEIDAAEWSPRLAQSQAENGEAPASSLPTLTDPDARWLCAIVDPLTDIGSVISDGGRTRVLGIAERLESALNSLWAIKELASGLGETLIEAEAERLMLALRK